MAGQQETCQHLHYRVVHVGLAWRCDVCHAGPYANVVAHMHCDICDHDICDVCHGQEIVGGVTPPLSPSFLCPRGHTTQAAGRIVSWHCNHCRDTFPPGSVSAYCDTCDFDCCSSCVEHLQGLVCPLGHPVGFSHPLPCNGWRCDVCHNLADVSAAPCRCAVCDYDMCASCLRAALVVAKNSAAAAKHRPQPAVAAVSPVDPDAAPWGANVKRLVLLSEGTDEYASCVGVFKPTLPPKYNVRSIHRVENSRLYARYSNLRRIVARDNGGDPNVVHVMHGTRGQPTENIALDDDGVDMRFSASGCMFGRASYFSHDTGYVTGSYAHRPPALNVGGDEVLEFLMCEVACGKSEHRSAGNVVRPSPGYHSVNGHVTPGVLAVMCYQLHQSYPCYLVTVVAHQWPPQPSF